MENFNHILLFKTNINSEECIEQLKIALDTHRDISKWNVALDDEDYVLRIVSYTLKHQQIIELINAYGFLCSELN